MFYEETNPPDIEESIVIDTVHSCFPQIENPSVQFHYHGTYNVYVVENKYIFRFPSTYHSPSRRREYVRREVKLLDLLRSHLIYPVPKPEFVDTATDYPYMGYKMIPGERLSIHSSNATPEQLRFVGTQMGRFIGGLHSLSENVLESEAGPFTPEAYRKKHAETYYRIQKLVLPTLTNRQRDWAETLFHDFLDPDENFEFNPVIAHCDLYAVNILVDPVSFRVTGILDFENLDLNDPAADFIFLREGTGLLTSLIQEYPHEQAE